MTQNRLEKPTENQYPVFVPVEQKLVVLKVNKMHLL